MRAVLYRRLAMSAGVAGALLAMVQFGAGSAATETAENPVRRYAEGLAEAASKEFDTVLERQRLAQAQRPKPDASPAAKMRDHAVGPPLSWFQHSAREFQTLMGLLAGGAARPQPWDPVADAEKKASASASSKKAETSQIAQPPPKAAAAPPPVGKKSAEAEPDKRADPKKDEDVTKAEQARRKAEAKRASDARLAADAKAADEAKKTADAKAAAEAKKAAEAKRIADAKAAAEDAKRTADAKAADAAKKPADARAADAKKAAEASREAEAQAAIDAARAAEVKRAAAAKAAVDAATKASTNGRQGKVAADAGKAAAKSAPQSKRVADARTAAKAPARRSGHRGHHRRRGTCRAAGTHIHTPGWYVVRKGDTLSAIARRHYGASRGYWRIRMANRRTIRNADKIHPCQRIYLPRRG